MGGLTVQLGVQVAALLVRGLVRLDGQRVLDRPRRSPSLSTRPVRSSAKVEQHRSQRSLAGEDRRTERLAGSYLAVSSGDLVGGEPELVQDLPGVLTERRHRAGGSSQLGS